MAGSVTLLLYLTVTVIHTFDLSSGAQAIPYTLYPIFAILLCRRHLSLLRSLASDGRTLVPIHTILEIYRVSDMRLVSVMPSGEDEVNAAAFSPLPVGAATLPRSCPRASAKHPCTAARAA